ncbi:MAG: FIST C-terminal domain-containing protein [Wenzhouxiangella sp.]|nr:FIST C-terminal domain-containing protein [Wenzhouxiangella sp.]
MKLIFDERDSLDALEHALSALSEAPNIASLMVLGCSANAWPKKSLDSILKSLRLPVFGGLFPNINFRARCYRQGLIVAGFSRKADLATITGLSQPEINLHHCLNEQTHLWPGATDASTLMLFVDGTAPRIDDLVNELFFSFGLDHSFVGGGAGSLDFTDAMPCIITPDGLINDAAICARLPLASSIGVGHGWEPEGHDLLVTAARGNMIDALDHEAALPVYERCLQRHDLPPLSPDNFFEHARHHPFGIRKPGEEIILRCPVRISRKGSLVCLGEVPVGSAVQIMGARNERLISAAREARATVDDYMLNTRGSCYLVLGSVSRALCLGDSLGDELQGVSQNDLSFGAFTLGEIANTGQEFLQFYNNSIAVARFQERLEP